VFCGMFFPFLLFVLVAEEKKNNTVKF